MSKMIKSSEVKKGKVFKFENKFYECIEVTYISGFFSRSTSKVKIVAKRIIDGAIVEITFTPNEYVEQVDFNENKMTFMYEADEKLYFVDSDTYDMIEVSNTKFEWDKNFLTTNLEISCLICENEIIKINFPDTVCLTIISCDAIDRSKPVKGAVCETGLKVNVPLFINEGERIYVSTFDGRYKGRAR